MDLELKKALREEFLKEWVNQATKEEIVKMLILNDERAKKIEKAYQYLDKFVPNEYGYLLTERQWNYIKELLKGDENDG